MNLSLGFLVILILVIFPGLIYRRLYYYGEFSQEFKSDHNLAGILAISVIPGAINLILVFILYNKFFGIIDLGEIVDKFKDINNPEFRFSNSDSYQLNVSINKIPPFIGFLYTSSIISGLLSGRVVRISRLDTKFKLLRFKNFWFYLFNGQHTNFKKMQHLGERDKKHLFTKADILIDTNSQTLLYSGIVVDYELQDNNCNSLSKVMLQNAERYSKRDGARVKVDLPGNILVVDCTSMKNINLTYVYEETKSFLKSKVPGYIELALGVIILILIPIFIFQSDNIGWKIYKDYFELRWYERIIAYLLVVQVLGLFVPFQKKGTEYKMISSKVFFIKIITILVLLFIIWLL